MKILKMVLGKAYRQQATIIDIHCGSGRHALALAQQGFRVIGMEEVTMPLQQAREKAKQQKVNARFLLSTARNHRAFAGTADIVISMFNSLGYTFSQKDDEQQFKWIAKLLKPKGYFVLDIRNHDFQKKTYIKPKTQSELLSFHTSANSIATMLTTKFWHDNRLVAIEKIIVNAKVAQQMTYGWNTYAPETLVHMLNNAGLKLMGVHEDYYTIPENFSERIFIVAQKK